MKNALILSFVFICNCVCAQTPANDPHWQILWQDDFSSFDSNKWVKAEYCDHNGEPQLYTADNVDIWNGKLRIRLFSIPNVNIVCGVKLTMLTFGMEN